MAHAARVSLAFVWRRRRARITLICALLALPVLGGAWLWVRSSPFVSVEHVQLSGVHGPESGAIESALTAAARQMSTLDVNTAALRAAVAPFPVVREVRAIPRLPHGLRIDVLEQLPVAALTVGSVRTAVAADGVVLGPGLLSSSLPTLAGAYEPAAGQRVRGSELLASLTVLGDAPAPLARLISRVFSGPRGLTVAMRSGLLAYFGDASRPHAKWLSLARVLADPSSAGASYVDVRLPERPAAGFPTGTTAPDSTSTTASTAGSEQASAGEATVAALAARLTVAVGGGASTSTTPSEPATEPASAAPSASEQAAPTTAPITAPTSETTATPGG